jgi:23S rRNA G2445 N2-methylase RlmL
MAFDTDTRNKLAKMVADASALLKNEFTQQLQEIYGIQPDGNITALEKLSHLDDEQRDIAEVLRERVAHISAGASVEKKMIKAAVDRMIREQSFTVLNRFAALRMCEERGLFQQCVGSGLQSKGFQVYLRTSGSGLGSQYERFRTFIFSIFDEISIDLGILFDRFSPFGLLFPREIALNELLEVINREDLKHIWAEDEVIGWIYQYFNSPEERRAMRKASTAPRNSRELAVRNQFFTPRYVVEFLTDNTLGRIWYEMCRSRTSLKENCRYLVYHPNEVFLEKGQKPPKENEASNENLSQEELLNRTNYIPFRSSKDPRDLKVLDPACGSGHFLLYAFDLLETIYEEAWQDNDFPPSIATGKSLREDFESLNELRIAIPELILRWNLHGIDIDPRAVQIAALALWLRAQRSWQKQRIKTVERPHLTKSNIVCAEPMPGDENLLKEFAVDLKPKVLGQLLEVIFEKMKLAGEAGPLLKIEKEIKETVTKARKQWEAKPKLEQDGLFPELKRPVPKQQELQFDVSDIDDKKFWNRAETLILRSLKKYAEQAENGMENRRRMFAEDTAHGFSFIDLCQKRFDIVLMNPPYGATTTRLKKLLKKYFVNAWLDIYAAFMERSREFLLDKGFYGAIISRTFLHLSKFEKFRSSHLYSSECGGIIATDLGSGVLDSAAVETIALTYSKQKLSSDKFIIINAESVNNRASFILRALNTLKQGRLSEGAYITNSQSLKILPKGMFAYYLDEWMTSLFAKTKPLRKKIGPALPGLQTDNDFRFIRLWWEVPPQEINKSWFWTLMGGDYERFYRNIRTLVLWENSGKEIKAHVKYKYDSTPSRLVRNEGRYFQAGLTYIYTGKTFSVQFLPEMCIPTVAAQGIYLDHDDDFWVHLAYLNSSTCQILIKSINPGRFFQSSYVEAIPIVNLSEDSKKILRDFGKKLFLIEKFISRFDQTSIGFQYFFTPGVSETYNVSIEKYSKSVSFLRSEIVEAWDILEKTIKEENHIPSKTKYMSGNDLSSRLKDNIVDEKAIASEFCDWLIGIVFGRFDIDSIESSINISLIERFKNDVFSPLPKIAPCMLKNKRGLPARPEDVTKDYPIRISWNGVLVDDESHKNDIVVRVLEAIDAIFKDGFGNIEQKICEILGVSKLKDYFSKPNNFFSDHYKRYSKNRRIAPIYWPLSTESGLYTLWIYYHRMTDQTLFTCVNDYVNPKIEATSKDIERLQKELTAAGSTKKRAELEKLQDFRQELIDFRDDLLSVAKLPYKPNLNDGVIITASPLWKLFRLKKWQNDVKNCWEKLKSGEYDWARLAYSIWPERVQKKCRIDPSIAIAHDLEHLYKS